MSETIEYYYTFAIGLSLAVFSIAIVSGALPSLHSVDSSTQFSKIIGAADSAYLERGADGVPVTQPPLLLLLSNATVSCSDGIMAFSSGNLTSSQATDWPFCTFHYSDLSGFYQLMFYQTSPDTLALSLQQVNETA